MADIYVALDGSDPSGTGSSGSPYGTPNKAIGLAAPGDNILLYGGIYPYRVNFTSKNGALGAPITIKPVTGQTVTIAGQANTLYCILVSDSDYIIVDGLRIIYNYALTLPDSKMAWVRFQGASNHCQIKNFYIKRDWVTSSGTPRTAKQEYDSGRKEVGVSVGTNCVDVTVGGDYTTRGDNSEIIGINKCVQFTDYIASCQVLGVNCHDYLQQGVDLQGLDPTREAGILLKGCIFDGSINEDGVQSHPNPIGTGVRTIRGIRIKDCEIRNNAENAIDLKAGENWTIEDSFIHGTWGSSGGQFGVSASSFLPNRRSMHAIMVGDAEPGYNVILRNTVLYDNPAATIFQQGWTAYNCTFHRNKRDYTGPESTYDDTAGQFPDFGGVVPTATSIPESGTGAFTNMGVRNCAFINEQVGIAMRSGQGDFDADYNAFVNMTGRAAAVCDSAPYSLKTLAQWRIYLAAQGWSAGTEINSFEVASLTACKYAVAVEHPTGDAADYDYSLASDSPLKGTGGHLTTVVNAVTASNTIKLANANYFTDGYGRPGEGDLIFIVGAGAGARQILDVDYATGDTILDATVTCAAGAKVYWGDAASADIGVTVAAAEEPPPPPSGGSSSLQTVRVAAATTAGTQNIPLPAGLVVAPIAVDVRCVPLTADNVPADGLSMSSGFFVSSGQQFSVAIRCVHGVSTTDTDRRNSTTDCIILLNPTSNAIAVRAAGVSISTTTFALNWITPPPLGYFVELDLIPGTAASIVTVPIALTQNASAPPIAVAHAWNNAELLGNGKGLDTGYTNAHFTRGFATKIAGVLTQNALGWWSQNIQSAGAVVAAQIFTGRIGGHVTVTGDAAWALELTNPSGNNIDLTTRDGTPGDPEVVGILFVNSDVSVWTGTIAISAAAGVQPFTAPGFPASAVNLITSLMTALGIGFSDNLASSFGFSTLTADANYSMSLTDRDAINPTDSQMVSHAIPLDLRQYDGGAGIVATAWASIALGFSMTLTSAVGGRAIARVWASGSVALTATDLVTGAPVLGTPALAQTHALAALGITGGAPVLDTPTLAQTHVLAALGIVTGAPALDTPALAQTHVLVAVGLTTGAPVLDTPSLAEVGGLLADNLVTGAPVLDPPTLGEVNTLTATDLATGAPVLDLATIGQVHVLLALGIVTGAPVLDGADLAQSHALTTADLLTGAPVLGTAALAQTHQLQALDLETGSPVLDTPIFTLNLAVGLVTVLFRVRKPRVIFRVGED